jgi:hypothetical protein
MLAEKVVGGKECTVRGNRPIAKSHFGIGDINAQSSRQLFLSIGKIAKEFLWICYFWKISRFRKSRSRAAISQSQFLSQAAQKSLEREQGGRTPQVRSLVPVRLSDPPALIRATITCLSNTHHIYMGLRILLNEEIDLSVQLGRT